MCLGMPDAYLGLSKLSVTVFFVENWVFLFQQPFIACGFSSKSRVLPMLALVWSLYSLVCTTILLRVHGCSILVMSKRHKWVTSFLILFCNCSTHAHISMHRHIHTKEHIHITSYTILLWLYQLVICIIIVYYS